MKAIIIQSVIFVLIAGGVIYWFTQDRDEEVMETNDTQESVAKSDNNSDNNIVIPEDTTSMRAIIQTNQGEITLELFSSDAPKTVENFTKLAKEGFYNGTKFHRVIKGFMIQGGDPFTKDDSLQNQWGTGDPGYKFDDEIHANNKNNTVTIAMANSGPNTNGSQFFINVANNNSLDEKHTVFGKVVSGMEVVQAIENVATESSDRPVEVVIVESITITEN